MQETGKIFSQEDHFPKAGIIFEKCYFSVKKTISYKSSIGRLERYFLIEKIIRNKEKHFS